MKILKVILNFILLDKFTYLEEIWMSNFVYSTENFMESKYIVIFLSIKYTGF